MAMAVVPLSLFDASWVVVGPRLPEMLDGYSTLAALRVCKGVRMECIVMHMQLAKEKFEHVQSYLCCKSSVPFVYADDEDVEFTLLPLNPASVCPSRSVNAFQVEAFEQDCEELSALNYQMALSDYGLAKKLFLDSWRIRGGSEMGFDSLPFEHGELLQILHPGAFLAPGHVRLLEGVEGGSAVYRLPRMVYFGVAFGNFWCILLVRGACDVRIDLSVAVCSD